MKKTSTSLKTALAVCFCVCAATASWAADGVWSGTVDAQWTNSANWSAAYPSGAETATFTNGVPAITTIDVAGLTSIRNITFDSPSVAAYTNGTGAANSQTLVLADSGVITLTDTAANSQLFNAGLQLGTTMAAGTYTITNANTSQTLTFNQVFGAPSGGTAAGKTLNINGPGNTTVLDDLWRGGASSLTLTHNSSGTLNLAGSNTVYILNMNGGTNSVVDIGSGFLALSNAGGNVLNCSQGGEIKGTGKIWLSTTSGLEGYNYADLNVATNKTLVINPEITGLGGIETWTGSGTFVLNGMNTFAAHIQLAVPGSTISVGKIGNCGSVDSNLGQGTNINFYSPNTKLIYTGIGETSNRKLLFNNSPVILDQSGTSGTLDFSVSPTLSSGAKTLTLQGSNAGIGTFSAPLINSSGVLSILKAGSGTWILSAANTYSGTTTINGGTLALTGVNGAINASSGYTINAGGVLLLENASDANNTNRLHNTSTITLNGGTLSIPNNGGAVSYGENAGALVITPGGTSTIATTEAIEGQTNTLTFTSLAYNGGRINFTGTGIGESVRNRIFIGGVTNGLMGAWATVNGTAYAAYSSTLGVYAAAPETTFIDIAAEGGVAESIIPDNGALWARINLPGVSGPITLQGEWTNRIGYVLQNTTTNTTIAMFDGVTNKLLRAAGLSIAEGKNELKVGVSENDGYLSALTAGGSLVLENNSMGNALIVNSAIVNNTSASPLSKIGTGTVVLKGTNTYSGNTYLTAGVLDYSVSTLTQTVGAVISGAGSLVKSGAGTLNLNAANTFTGGLKINEGIVVTAQTSGLGAGPVTNNSTLNLTGGALTYTGLSTSLSGAGTNNVTLSTGTATTTLNGDYSAFTGVWNIGINAAAGAARAQMTGAPTGVDNSEATINVLSNATLWAYTAGTHQAKLILNGGDQGEPYGQLRIDTAVWAGPITLAGPITAAADGFIGSQNQDGIISGIIGEVGGPYELSKVGNNRTTLTGNNTFIGPVWVKAGTVGVPVMGSISGGASPLGQPTTADQGRVKLGNTTTAGVLSYTGAGETTDRMIDLAGTTAGGTLEQSGTGLLKLTGGMMISGSGNKTLTLQGSTSGTGEFAGVIFDGVDSMISVAKVGTGTWTLSNANTYTGLTTVTTGTLSFKGPATLPAMSEVSMNAGTLQVLQDGSGNNGIINVGNNITLNAGITATIDVGNIGSANTGNTVAFGALNNGTPANAFNSTISFTGANGYLQSFTTLRLTGLTGGTTTLNPTTTSVTILGNVFNQAPSPASGQYDMLTLDGTSTGNTILGCISDSPAYFVGRGDTRVTKSSTSTWTLSGNNTYRGPTTVNAGTLIIGGAGKLGEGVYANTIANTGIFVHDSSADQSLTGAISGSGGQLRKTGTGTLTLSAVNTYTGETSISNGVLRAVVGGSCASSAFTLAAATGMSASLEVGVTDNTKQWTCPSLTVNNGGVSSGLTIDFGYQQPSTSLPPLVITNALTLTTTPVLTIKGVFLPPTTGNGYPLMTWGSGSAASIATVILPGRLTGSVVVIGTTNYLQISENNQPLTWATGAGAWDLSTANWKDIVGTSATYSEATLPGDQVLFTDMYVSEANTTVTLDSAVMPANMTVTNDVYNYILSGSGSITGGTRLNKSGSGTLTLGTPNTYSGGTYIGGGTLVQANASALPLGTTLFMSGAGLLDMNGNATTLNNISASTAANTIIDTSAGAGTTALSILNHTTTIAATIKDGASKTVAVNLANLNGGVAAFALNSSNTFSGGLTLKHTVSGGTRLVVGSPVITVGTAGFITSSPFGRGAITIGEAATDRVGIYINADNATIANELIVNANNGTDVAGMAIRTEKAGIRVDGKVTVNASLSMGANSGTGYLTLTNVISGVGGVIMPAGGGTLNATLTGPNTYLGKTIVNKGTLSFNSIKNVGEGASALGAPTTVANGTIDLATTLQYTGAATSSDRIINLLGSCTVNNSGTGTLTLNGGFTGGANNNLLFRGGTTIVANGIIAHNGLLSKTDSGVLYLNNSANSFTGEVVVADGTIIIDSIANSGLVSTLGKGNRIRLGQDSGTIGTLRFTGANGGSCNREIFIFGTSVTAGGIIENAVSGKTLTLSGNISKGGTGAAPRLQLAGAGDGVFSGNIISNTLSILKIGAGKWTFTGNNSYTGATTVAGGTLALSGLNSGAITNSLAYTITSGAMLVLENTAAANNTNRLGDASAITLENGILSFTNTAGTASYYEKAGGLFVTNSGGTIVSAQAALGRTNILSLGTLTRTGYATLDFKGEGIGTSPRNRIFIQGQPDGLIGLWATINTTNYAAYDSTLGVIVAGSGVSITNILAKGPSIIPDDATLNAWINAEGTEGGITLTAAVTNRIKTLLQNTDWPATVAMTNQTLLVNEVGVSAGNARSLTLGTALNEGAIAPLNAGGDLQLTASASDSVLTVNAAISNNTTASSVTKLGLGTVVLAGTNIFTGNLNVNSGTLSLRGSNALAGAVVNVGGVTGDAVVKMPSGSSLVGTGETTIGSINNGNGAFYLSGGQVVRTNTDADKNFSFGTATGGYGYFNMSAGTLTSQRIGLGIAGNVGMALARITGGIGTFNSWVLIGRAGGIGVMTIDSGSVIQTGTANSLMLSYDGGRGELNMTGGLFDNAGKPLIVRQTAGSGSTGIVNVCSGTLIVNSFVNRSTAYLNFNGGLLKAGGNSLTFLPANMTGVYVNGPFGANAGGANIDSANKSITFVAPLSAPTGNGVTAITLSTQGSGYIGEPYVSITGDGVGATAVANMEDDGTGNGTYKVASVTVTTPGVNYTSADVSFLKGGATAVAPAASATLGTTAPAGLTKLGLGTLTLSGTNTYAGATTISNGTVRLGIANALPDNAAVIVDGGTYDLGGFSVTNGSTSLIRGAVISGTLNNELTKVGDGIATALLYSTSSPITISGGTLLLPGVQPGVYEGRILNNAFDQGSENPRTAIKLSVTNAFQYYASSAASGGIWPDNTTYIYNGYLWNRSTTNEVWTFCKRFDDSVSLIIDATSVINNTGSGDTITRNYIMTPGPHAIEVRLGQGGGAVGPGGGYPGVGFDRLGRNTANAAYFQRLADPGDGSLLTLSASSTNLSSVTITASATLDLGGAARVIENLDGSGTVSNGTLTVTGTISPAGTNDIDVLTAKANTTLSGKLLVNVATDGTSDCLDVQGNLDLSSSPTLEIVDLMGLNPRKMYTLITYSGTLSGSLTLPGSLNNTLWALRTTPDGAKMKMQLYYRGGTLIRVM